MKHSIQNPTKSYRPTGTAFVNHWNYFFTSDPWFTWGDVMMMARDPAVKYGLRLLRSPYAKIKIKSIAARPAVARYIQTTWATFMRQSVPKLLNNYFKWGRAPGGIEWEWDVKTETLKLQTVRAIEPIDAIAQVWREGTKKNQFAGFTLQNTERTQMVCKPYAFWFSGFNEWGQFCDEPRIASAYAPWLEKNAPMGLRASRRLFNWTKAVGVTVVRHPDGMITQPDGSQIPAENKALQSGAALQNGSIIALNSARTEDGSGYKWDVDQRQSASGDGKYLGESIKDADNEIWTAMGIPNEIVRSGDTGSGYSGRAIPMETWLASSDELAQMLNSEFRHQVLEPGMKNSFGKVDYDGYEITSLLEEYLESQKQGQQQPGQEQGQGQGAGSGGSSGQQSRKPSSNWQPDGTSRNGTPRERNDSGQRRYVNLSTLDEGDEDDQLHDSDPQTMHQDKHTLQLRHAVALAMIEAQIQGRGQDTLDALSELADDPDEVGKALGSVSLAWLDYGSSRSGKQRWKDESTGKIRYQKSMPGTARTKSEKRAGTARQAHDIIGKLLRSEATADHLRELATHLPELTVKELQVARAKLGAKFKDGRTRDKMVRALLNHVEGEQEKLGAQEPKTEVKVEAKAEEKPEPKVEAKPEEKQPDPVAPGEAAVEPEAPRQAEVAQATPYTREDHEKYVGTINNIDDLEDFLQREHQSLGKLQPHERKQLEHWGYGRREQKLNEPKPPRKPLNGRDENGREKPLTPEQQTEFKQSEKQYRTDVKQHQQDKQQWEGKYGNEAHRKAVEDALASGKPVPPEVLADYPDLQAKSAPSAPQPTPEPATPQASEQPPVEAPKPATPAPVEVPVEAPAPTTVEVPKTAEQVTEQQAEPKAAAEKGVAEAKSKTPTAKPVSRDQYTTVATTPESAMAVSNAYAGQLPQQSRDEIQEWTDFDGSPFSGENLPKSIRIGTATPEQKKVHANIVQTVDAAPKLPEPVSSYRGEKYQSPAELASKIAQLKKMMETNGDFQFPTLASASYDPTYPVAEYFTSPDKGLVYHIEGQSGLPIDGIIRNANKIGQKEVIHSPNSKYTVVSIEQAPIGGKGVPHTIVRLVEKKADDEKGGGK